MHVFGWWEEGIHANTKKTRKLRTQTQKSPGIEPRPSCCEATMLISTARLENILFVFQLRLENYSPIWIYVHRALSLLSPIAKNIWLGNFSSLFCWFWHWKTFYPPLSHWFVLKIQVDHWLFHDYLAIIRTFSTHLLKENKKQTTATLLWFYCYCRHSPSPISTMCMWMTNRRKITTSHSPLLLPALPDSYLLKYDTQLPKLSGPERWYLEIQLI